MVDKKTFGTELDLIRTSLLRESKLSSKTTFKSSKEKDLIAKLTHFDSEEVNDHIISIQIFLDNFKEVAHKYSFIYGFQVLEKLKIIINSEKNICKTYKYINKQKDTSVFSYNIKKSIDFRTDKDINVIRDFLFTEYFNYVTGNIKEVLKQIKIIDLDFYSLLKNNIKSQYKINKQNI